MIDDASRTYNGPTLGNKLQYELEEAQRQLGDCNHDLESNIRETKSNRMGMFMKAGGSALSSLAVLGTAYLLHQTIENADEIKEQDYQKTYPAQMQNAIDDYVKEHEFNKRIYEAFNKGQTTFVATFPEEDQQQIKMQAEQNSRAHAKNNLSVNELANGLLTLMCLWASVAMTHSAVKGYKKDKDLYEKRSRLREAVDVHTQTVQKLKEQMTPQA